MSKLTKGLATFSLLILTACGSANLMERPTVSRAHELANYQLQGPVFVKLRSFQAEDTTFQQYAGLVVEGLSSNGVTVATSFEDARYIAFIDYSTIKDRHKLGNIGFVEDNMVGFTSRSNEKIVILRIYDLDKAEAGHILPSIYEGIASVGTKSLGDKRVADAMIKALFSDFYARVRSTEHASITSHWSDDGAKISE